LDLRHLRVGVFQRTRKAMPEDMHIIQA
jgi:hypothetical protein